MVDAARLFDRAGIRELCAGMGFLEGPLWTSTGELMVASVSRGQIYRVSLEGGAGVIVDIGGTPTGLAEDIYGRIWIMQPGPSALRTRSERAVEQACLQSWSPEEGVSDHVIEGVDAPNDCVLGPDDRLWLGDMVVTDEGRLHRQGRVSALDVDSLALEWMTEQVIFPNGIVFNPEKDRMYVSSTLVPSRSAGEILAFSWDGTTLGDRQVFAQLEGNEHADGLAVDVDGRVYVATSDGDSVRVFDEGGSVVEVLELPGAHPASVCFADPERKTLIVAAAHGGRILAVPTTVAGSR